MARACLKEREGKRNGTGREGSSVHKMAFALIKKMKQPVGVGDMVLLDTVDEDSIVQNLKERVLKDEIYVRFPLLLLLSFCGLLCMCVCV